MLYETKKEGSIEGEWVLFGEHCSCMADILAELTSSDFFMTVKSWHVWASRISCLRLSSSALLVRHFRAPSNSKELGWEK